MKRRPQATPSMKGNKDSESEDKENSNPLHHSSSPVPGPEESVILAELRECIKQVLEKLERNQANLIVMRDFQDLSYDEIANSLALSLSAIKMRIHRDRLAFQEFFMQLCGAEYLRFSVPSSYSFKDTGYYLRQNFRPGQQLTLGNYSGTVRSTSGAYTVLDVTNESGQRSTISLPNTLLLESVVTGRENAPGTGESSNQP